jgi:hypothetical protein
LYLETEERWKMFHADRKFDFHATQNEASTRHFFRSPTKMIYKAPVRSVRLNDGNLSSAPQDIQHQFVEHWKAVMREDDRRPPNRAERRRFVRILQKRLTTEDRDTLEADVTGVELQSSIDTMAPNKTPGPDGFPACFYQTAPAIFGEILSIVMNYQLNRGELLKCQRTSEVVLLFKKNDRADPGNYRPISLMPVEIKILCRALTHRLAPIMPRLVLPTQKGFVQGRRLHDHVVHMLDLQHHCSVHDQEGYAAFLDFAKAYDRVNWEYMFETLEEFGFGPKFLAWIRLLYHHPIVHLRVNGQQSTPIYPNRGVKQGDPISSLLFVLTLEPLNQLLQNNETYGVLLPHGEFTSQLLFADDTTLLAGSVADLQEQLTLVQQYCSMSGAKLNLGKTEILTLNAKQDVPIHPDLTFSPSGKPIRYLGILVGHNLPANYQVDRLTESLYNTFRMWGCRARTLRGRRLLVQSVILPILWHFTAVIVVPPKTLDAWQSIVNRFIQNRVTEPSKRSMSLLQAAHQYDKELGWKVPHLRSIISYQRLRRLQLLLTANRDGDDFWATLVDGMFRAATEPYYRPSQHDYLHFRPNPRTAPERLARVAPLWRDAWNHWLHLPTNKRCQSPPTIGQLIMAPVWIQQNPLFHIRVHVNREPTSLLYTFVGSNSCRPWYDMMAEAGLHCLGDFLTPQRTWPDYDEFNSIVLRSTLRVHYAGPVPFTLLPLYRRLTVIARCIYEHVGHHWGAPVDHGARHLSLPFVARQGDTYTSIHEWTPKQMKQICLNPPAPTRTHPVASNNRTTPEAISLYLKRFHTATKSLSPLQSDLWFRIIYQVLPVGSKFYHLQLINPDCILCAYPECLSVETMEHALQSCPAVLSVWSVLEPPWQQFGLDLQWSNIMNFDKLQTLDAWNHAKPTLLLLWTSLVGGTLRRLWLHRNKVKYQDGAAPHVSSMVELILLAWTSQVRRHLQDPSIDHTDLAQFQTILHQLGQHPNFHGFWSKYPNHFSVNPLTKCATLK